MRGDKDFRKRLKNGALTSGDACRLIDWQFPFPPKRRTARSSANAMPIYMTMLSKSSCRGSRMDGRSSDKESLLVKSFPLDPNRA